MKEVQDVTAKKDKVEQQFMRLDQIQRDFEKAIKKVEEQEEMIKLRNEQLEEVKKQMKTDKKHFESDKLKLASAIEVIQKAEGRLGSLNNNQVARIKSEVGMKFDKAVIVREFEVLATSMKQV